MGNHVADGMTVTTAGEAAAQADLIHILLPDELQAGIYKNVLIQFETG